MLSFAAMDNLFFSSDEKTVWILGKERNSETGSLSTTVRGTLEFVKACIFLCRNIF